MPVILAHGAIAAVALVLLLVFVIQNPEGSPKTSLILFVVAALGGFYMFFRNLKQKIGPMPLAFFHALLAVGAFVLLLLYAFA